MGTGMGMGSWEWKSGNGKLKMPSQEVLGDSQDFEERDGHGQQE